MKITGFSSLLYSLLFCGYTQASVSMTLEFGQLTTSQSLVLPAGTLWALISENTANELPGGMLINQVLSVAALSVDTNRQAILTDFAGATIAPGRVIGGGVVLATGTSSISPPGDISAFVQFNTIDYAALGLNEGDKLGIYWFPGHTLESNTLPTDSFFEIGGFHRTSASSLSGGNAGMIVPSVGNSVTIAYFDDSDDISINPVFFKAVSVPEPSAILLVSVGAMIALRRRR
jgi:hypothetical protein